MVSSQECSFIDQIVHYHASGGDLDALVLVMTSDGTGGVRIEDHPRHGYTRLYYAADLGWCSATAWLLERGADVHLGYPSHSLTPLHIAAARGHCNAAVLLLDAGARLDDRSQSGRTALHFAAANNHPKMCKLLLSRGASLDARDNVSSLDPEALARVCGHPTLADFLAAVRAAGGWSPPRHASSRPRAGGGG